MILYLSKTVDAELIEKLEVVGYHLSSKKDVLLQILQNQNINISEERFEKYCKEYDDLYIQYEKWKAFAESLYVLPLLDFIKASKRSFEWTIEYNTFLINIKLHDFDRSNILGDFQEFYNYLNKHNYVIEA